MSNKLQILFVACIICTSSLDVAIGRPDIADVGLNPVGDTGLDVNGASEREKRQFGCSNTGGCYNGFCWAGCFGALDAFGAFGNSYNF